jgi:hypothetical protein
MVLAPLEARLPVPERIAAVERSILVDAPPAAVWDRIVNPGRIDASDLRRAWMFRIGVPLPVTGATEQTASGRVRRVTMTKQVHFDEVITDWRPGAYVRWVYRFAEDSFPPGALDDHVRVGGQYFDLLDTSYTITPAGARTELKLRMSYRVSTQFNWYADPLARLLLGNMAGANLEYYARRASGAQARAE